MRRGVAELDGKGEVAGGVVVIRFGENALKVIDAVKKKLEIAKQGLPSDVKIVPVYDRSNLILRAIDNLRDKLVEEIIIVALHLHNFSSARPKRACRGFHASHGNTHFVHHYETSRDQRQYHVPFGHCHCHRGHGGRGDHHDRKPSQAP
jgi:hypothetical protein